VSVPQRIIIEEVDDPPPPQPAFPVAVWALAVFALMVAAWWWQR